MARADEYRWLVEWNGMWLKAFDPKTESLTWTKDKDKGIKMKLGLAKPLAARLNADRDMGCRVDEID